MIEAHSLTKVRGGRRIVDDLSFSLRAGTVTGFLGPNGAGKSSTLRMVLGLDRPTSGTVTIDGRPHAGSPAPLRSVGAVLDAAAVHPGRTGRAHLSVLAATHGLGRRRVDEVLAVTGIADAAAQKVGKYSLGMRQRLGIAAALLGDPAVLILDEPVNGLDPAGVVWLRELCRGLAAEGRTVLLSSHNMAETAETADHVVVIAGGRKVADGTLPSLLAESGRPSPTLEQVFFDLTATVPARAA